MRLPVVAQISTKDGTGNRNARLTNCLKESKKTGDKAVVRPGLVLDAQASGVGHGLVVFDNHLVSVYGTTLGFDPITTDLSATIATYTPIASRAFNSIGYNGTIYVAVGYSTSSELARAYTSSDGQSWTSRTIPSGYYRGESIVWNGTTWLFTVEDSDNTGEIFSMLSTNGTSWAAYNISGAPSDITDTSNAYGGGYFFSNTDNGLYRSADGQTWAYMGGAVGTLDMAYGNGYLVSVGDSATTPAYYSSDLGVTLTGYMPLSSQTITRISGVCFDGSRFVAISADSTGSGASILAGTTGANLEEISVITSFQHSAGTINNIDWNGSCYVATSINGAYAVSDDAITWTEYSSANAFRLALCAGASGFNFFLSGTPGLITATASMTSIPALATITGDYYDFAQSPI